ncbi:MAG TPA: PLP-dependent aminotransferase family protein [Anaerolineales bacterium]|nr:PLP-dependent aminotransferase family protein [Anaerolineales bacterium]
MSVQTTQIPIAEGFIDLGRGDPQLALLPLDLLRRAAEARLSQPDNSFLQYGPEQGDGYLRWALARFLARDNTAEPDPERLFITAGISNALDLLCTLLTCAGDTILVEEPSYFLALSIFADHGLRVVPLPTDGSGLVIEALEEALTTCDPKFLYIIPTFQNPSGHTLPEARRRRLAALSQEYGFLVLADEVYQYLNYGAEPPRAFGTYAGFENVVSLGSFSKILAPGLRLGWIQASPTLIRRLANCGLLTSGGGLNPFTSAIVRGLIEDGSLEHNIERLKQVYSARVLRMEDALRRYLPEGKFQRPDGGYFFWVRLPGCDTETLRRAVRALHADFRPGGLFSSASGLRDCVRLSISFYDGDEIDRGIKRLGEAFHAS